MEYSVEVIEMMCAHECNGNAQVTSPVPMVEEEVVAPTINAGITDTYNGSTGDNFESWMTSNAATNWLLAGIMLMIFLFMIFRCE